MVTDIPSHLLHRHVFQMFRRDFERLCAVQNQETLSIELESFLMEWSGFIERETVQVKPTVPQPNVMTVVYQRCLPLYERSRAF